MKYYGLFLALIFAGIIVLYIVLTGLDSSDTRELDQVIILKQKAENAVDQKDYPQAIKQFKEALSVLPDGKIQETKAEIHLHLAETLTKLKQINQAEQHFKQACELGQTKACTQK